MNSNIIVFYAYKTAIYDLSHFTNLDELIEVVSSETAKWAYDIQIEDLHLKWDIPFEHRYFLYDNHNSFSSIKESYFEFLSLCETYQEPALAYLEYINPEYKELLENIKTNYWQGNWYSKEDFATFYVHSIYQETIDTLPPILQHLDYKAIARDLFIDSFDYVDATGDVFSKR